MERKQLSFSCVSAFHWKVGNGLVLLLLSHHILYIYLICRLDIHYYFHKGIYLCVLHGIELFFKKNEEPIKTKMIKYSDNILLS